LGYGEEGQADIDKKTKVNKEVKTKLTSCNFVDVAGFVGEIGSDVKQKQNDP
jgi:hypothetical protein